MFNLILALNIFSLLTSVVLSVFAYKKRTNQIAYHFFLLMVIFAFWAICKILQLYAETLFFQVLLGDIIRSVTVFTPLLILNIVIGYSKYPKWFSKRHFNYLLLITGIMALLALISSISRFLAHDYQLIFDMGMSRLKWHSDFWGGDLLVIHRYCCLFVAILILIYCLIESTFVFKKQVLFILIGIALPAITNVLFWFNVSPVPHYPLVTESFAVGNMFFAYALLGHKFLKVAPIARNLVVDSMNDLMITINKDNLIVDLNKSCEKFFKKHLHDCLGFPFIEVFKEYTEIQDILERKESKEICLTINDNHHYFSAIFSTINLNTSEKLAYVLLLHNINDIQNAKFQLQNYAKELEIINATKDKFFSIIAHDLRGPIGSFKSLLEILITDFDLSDTSELKEILVMLKHTSGATYELLENLLSWAKSQRNEMEFKPDKIRLLEIINTINELFLESVQNKHVKIEVHSCENLFVYADKNMLMTVLRNLISNAIKFTPSGRQIQIITAKNEMDCIISIKDDGVGIKSEDKPKLFNKNIHFTTFGTSNEKGSGLGLMLCKEFVEKHGGNIWVESEVGKGSDFKFTIPLFDERKF